MNAHPRDYLNIFCLGNREPEDPSVPKPTKEPKLGSVQVSRLRGLGVLTLYLFISVSAAGLRGCPSPCLQDKLRKRCGNAFPYRIPGMRYVTRGTPTPSALLAASPAC